MISIEEFREDYDWRNVLSYAGQDECLQKQPPGPSAVGDNPPSADAFGMADVEEIIAASAGEGDGDAWLVVLKLRDGRFAYITAGCDYTGWDCRAGGSAWVASSVEDLVRWGLGEPERSRLNMPLPEAV